MIIPWPRGRIVDPKFGGDAAEVNLPLILATRLPLIRAAIKRAKTSADCMPAIQTSLGGPGPQGIPGEVGPGGPPFTSFDMARTTTPQGPAGKVTAAQLATAIAGTANNSNTIATIPVGDPPTQGELQQVLAKLNELIVGLRRA